MVSAVIYNLAIKLSTSYDIPVSGSLFENAKDAMKAVRKITRVKQRTSMPSTMSIGSGNEGDCAYGITHFYQGNESEILTEQGGSILLESEANE